MRITPVPSPDIAPGAAAADAHAGVTAAPAPIAPAPAAQPPSQAASLQPALAALRDLPAIDQARVAEIRDALERGALPFDTARLADLMLRYHGSSK